MRINILDHGYIELVESWGSDERVIEAARMSTNKGFQGWGGVYCECGSRIDEHYGTDNSRMGCEKFTPVHGDEKLLRYLYTHNHATPFEMAGAIIEVQAPIFVFREWHRHRTQSYNEMSARYTPLPDLNYIPTLDRLLAQGGSNKQAISTGATLNINTAEMFQEKLQGIYDTCESLYQNALVNGVPKELARLYLPVARYSRMRASANLRNWLAFLTLRMDQNAQHEIRQYANALHEILTSLFPRTLSLFDEGRNKG